VGGPCRGRGAVPCRRQAEAIPVDPRGGGRVASIAPNQQMQKTCRKTPEPGGSTVLPGSPYPMKTKLLPYVGALAVAGLFSGTAARANDTQTLTQLSCEVATTLRGIRGDFTAQFRYATTYTDLSRRLCALITTAEDLHRAAPRATCYCSRLGEKIVALREDVRCFRTQVRRVEALPCRNRLVGSTCWLHAALDRVDCRLRTMESVNNARRVSNRHTAAPRPVPPQNVARRPAHLHRDVSPRSHGPETRYSHSEWNSPVHHGGWDRDPGRHLSSRMNHHSPEEFRRALFRTIAHRLADSR